MITTRTSSSTGTIPAGTAVSGATITTSTADNKVLQVSGITAAELREAVTIKRNTWLYIPSTNVLRKIDGLSGDLNIRVTEATAGVSGLAFQIVVGNLQSWNVENTGAGAGVLNGGSIPSGTVKYNAAPEEPVKKTLDVVTFDGSGTTLVITEQIL